MIENNARTSPIYGDFVKQAYIDPIQTVVVLDDEFPTLDSLLAGKIINLESPAAKMVSGLIDVCRSRERPWLVDVHDGTNLGDKEEKITVGHLQHTDLLVLDYHLDRTNPTDGTRAIEILREMARNDHFNLVIVYTAGDQQAGSVIDNVVREIVIGLSKYNEHFSFDGVGFEKAGKVIEEWMDEDDEIEERIIDSVDEGLFLRVAQRSDLKWDEIYALPELAELKGLIDTSHYKQQWKNILRWALHKRQETIRSKYSKVELGALRFNTDDNEVNWIHTERLFVTVVSKTNQPSTLPDKLQKALNLWQPRPHRLLLTKMRAELDQRGALAEAEVLGNRPLQAGWLEEFLTEDESERAWKINANLQRHWESLGAVVRRNLSSFSSDFAAYLISTGREEVITKHSPLPRDTDRKAIVAELNRYACSKPVEGTHLTTGHILQIPSNSGEGLWVCLSPACDLVPGQRSGWFERLGQHIPFIAVELQPSNEEKALKNANSGNFLFFESNGEKRHLGFIELGTKSESNPRWEQFYAERQGHFGPAFSLRIQRLKETNGLLTRTAVNATVVSQLRYEYALNLLQRLGGNLSRVGLDFMKLST